MKKLLFLFSFSAISLWFLGCGAKPTSPQTTAQQQQQQNLKARTVYLRTQNNGIISNLDVQVIFPNNTQNLLDYNGPLTLKGHVKFAGNGSYNTAPPAFTTTPLNCSSQVHISCSANANIGNIRIQNCSAISRCCSNLALVMMRGQKLKETYSIESVFCD